MNIVLSLIVGDQLVPWIRRHYAVTNNAGLTTIGGYSDGGAAAAFTAMKGPDLFGNVLVQEYGLSSAQSNGCSVPRAQKHALTVRTCRCGRTITGNLFPAREELQSGRNPIGVHSKSERALNHIRLIRTQVC